MATLPLSRRFFGAIGDLGAGAGLIFGDPLKEAACTTVAILNLCGDTNSLSKDVEDLPRTKKKKTVATLQRLQSADDETFILLGSEDRATQQSGKIFRHTVNDHLQTSDEKVVLVQEESTLYKECSETQAKPSLFLQEI